jgi:hypothetical protein
MIICEFCTRYEPSGKCGLGLNIPKRMGCREFDPGMEKFCSNPKDFVSPGQIIEMATHFDIKGTELKKIKLMTVRADADRGGPGDPPAENPLSPLLKSLQE